MRFNRKRCVALLLFAGLGVTASASTCRAADGHWAFAAPTMTAVPQVKRGDWARTGVDRFVLAKLEEHGLSPAGPAENLTLIRRATFDLTGLPPTPEEVDAFTKDETPDAYEKVISRLLASPAYGQRWGRHWLDVVRYGETQGFERNRIRPNAWRYRDWVIDAFNQDLPYDEFVRRQIAGDVLHPNDLGALVATGYHVIGTWDQVAHYEGSESMRKVARLDAIEDLVATLGQAYMGLTINCARCHDHKFDPITQKEYYQVAALLGGVTQEEKERQDVKVAGQTPGPLHVIIPRQPPVFHELDRGNINKPKDPVAPAGIAALVGVPSDFGLAPDAPEAQRRVKLAEWLTDPRNPLTARVFVNRLWHYHFGQGIVDTPSDLGAQGGRPSHPELLDHLALSFVQSGWKVKDLHRLVMTSAVYRQRSLVRNDAAEAVDADNRLLWRFNRRRLDGESVRDAALAASGALNRQLGGPSYRDVKVEGQSLTDAFTDPTNEFSEDTCRRTVYRMWARSGGNPMLESLDCPEPSVSTPRRTTSITPIQALSLLNNAFMEQCAARFAQRARDEAGGEVDRQVDRAYRLALSRPPSAEELGLARPFVQAQGLEQFCLVLLNTNEFLFVN